VPNESGFIIELEAEVARIRVSFYSDRSAVIEFMVQLETVHDRQWKPVRRCDDYHGRPHLDILDRWGRETHKQWLDVDRNTALTMAIQDFKMSWEAYVAEFLEGDSHGQDT
jgi:hypothetical protein